MGNFVRYFIVKHYSGLFKKKFSGNMHFLLVPGAPKKMMYFNLLGYINHEKTIIAARWLTTIQDTYVDQLIKEEEEYFGDRFIQIEKIKCKTTQSKGKYNIQFLQKGKHILSDLKLEYQPEKSNQQYTIYFIEGDLDWVHTEVSPNAIKMAAAKQSAFLGDRF